MDALVGDNQHFVFNALGYWQPVKILQYGTDVIAFHCGKPGCR